MMKAAATAAKASSDKWMAACRRGEQRRLTKKA
jgi:hypothetical protein